ncbi:MAG: DUF4087 domain-containing protein [Acidobacteriota bacterium]|nr:DUF4087 domain-containing protein [Acidobacteriota bacterium]
MNKTVVKLRPTIVGSLLLTAVTFINAQPGMPAPPKVDQFETRCGWFSNPTPANVSLYDHDGEWIIGVQGGYKVEGDWEWSAFTSRQWVRTNVGSYGYGCVCLRLRVNRETHEVLAIKSSRARSLATCRQDRSLKRWKRLFD